MVDSPPAPLSTPIDLLAAFFDTSQPCEYFDDLRIERVAHLLARLGHCAQKEPRTYIVLRSIGRLDVLEQLLKAGFGDAWFPIEARSLPGSLDPTVRADIVKSQRLVLTKATDLENGRHCHFGPEEILPFTTLSRLGSGSFGQVTKIESTITFRQYALKTIRRRAAFGEQSKRTLKDILSEMRIMQSLQHEHIVRYIGSYTSKNSFGILMSPIAEQDLAAYLQHARPTMYPTIKTFFGCLATALSFLHENAIRHRDIKPQNILIYKSKVLLTDFGLSRDYTDTTSGPTQASPRYRAPEVAAGEGRNTSADIWALGCVFLEMLTTLRGHNVEWLKKYYLSNGDGITTNFHANLITTERLLNEWETATEMIDAHAIDWTKRMLEPRRNVRPSAVEIANEITTTNDRVSFMYSCNLCCDSETDSESIISVLEDLHDPLMENVSKSENDAMTRRNHQDVEVLGTQILDSGSFDLNSRTTHLPYADPEYNESSASKPTSINPSETNNSEHGSLGVKPLEVNTPDIQLSYIEPFVTEPSDVEHQSTESLITELPSHQSSNTRSLTTQISYIDDLSTNTLSTKSSSGSLASTESLRRTSVRTEPLQINPRRSELLQTNILQFEPLQFESLQTGPFRTESVPPESLLAKPRRYKARQRGSLKPKRFEAKFLPTESSRTDPPRVESPHNAHPVVQGKQHAMVKTNSFKDVEYPQMTPFLGIGYADYDISHIQFFMDDSLVCISGKVPLVFGRCIEFVLQSESRLFTDCLDFDKHKVIPFAIQHLLAAFDGSSTRGWKYDFSDCKASDVAQFLQMYLNSLPTPLLPLTLSTGLPLPDPKEITKCLLALKKDSSKDYSMGLCLIAFLATYVDLGKRHDPTQLWVSKVAEAYSLPRVIAPAPALPTLCFLIANARQFLKLEGKRLSPQPRWQTTSARALGTPEPPNENKSGQEEQNKVESIEQMESAKDVNKDKVRKRKSSRNVFRQLSGEGWRGWRKKEKS